MHAPEKTITFRPRVTLPEETLRPTRAEIDLSAIAHNFTVVRRMAAGARVLAVVKADGYGHGVVPVAHRLEQEGVDGFGVALAEEGLELREAGIGGEIVVLNGVYGGAHDDVLASGLTPVVYDLSEVDAFSRAARSMGRDSFGMHLKVDTGMSRLGVPHDLVELFLDGLRGHPGAHVEGVMTHLAAADTDAEFTREQLARFDAAIARIHAAGHRPRTVHAANTAATFLHPSARRDLVRPGFALYGYGPDRTDLMPAMRLRTEIIALRDLPAGATVGYDRTFRAERPMRVATVPMGYGDGLMRHLSGKGSMLVGGTRCPIVGRVSMDLTTLDVTALPGVAVGDEAVVLGAQGDAIIDAEEVAAAADTIAYEILTNVSRRVPRVYR